MASASKQTVFGFGTNLDWRPTQFVKVFPWNRVCSICGLVPSVVAMLPCCSCILCLPCYNRDAYDTNRCPLDGELFQENDVVWSTFTKDTILKRRIRCWNADNGCKAKDVASAVLEHFTNDCEFHTVSCPSCRGKFLHQDVSNHMASVCTARSPLKRKPRRSPRANESSDVMAALKKISSDNVLLKKQLESLERRITCDSDSARKVSCSVADKTVKAALEGTSSTGRSCSESECMLKVSSQVRDVLAENERNTRAFITQECNRIMKTLTEKFKEASSMGDADPLSRTLLLSDLSESIDDCLKRLDGEEALTRQDAARIVSPLAISSLAGASGALNVAVPPALRRR
ncbi:hypothetical protein HPB52_010166 [Rhipicephalus sanguineus]|uniref:Tnf receptor-associated factor n=1 Tax=Rhipicephalus sanguineus TaxID=34632 RepID=A0A9D4YMW4_RHISA|nr:hypothetical protein HPB52_010166 [Rhipicephalus sanguineus]